MNFLFNNQYILWILIYFGFSIILYEYGMKVDWQLKRIEKGLSNKEVKHAPGFFSKDEYVNKKHFGNCLSLFVGTMIASSVVVCAFYYVTTNKELSSWKELISTIVPLFLIDIILAGAPLKVEDVDDISKEKNFARIVNAISFVKLKLIERIVSKEYSDCKSFIIKYIKNFFESNDRVKQGVLIMRINSEFFNTFLPQEVDISLREEIQDYAYRLLVIYNKNEVTLLDELLKLFRENIINMHVNMEDIIEFITNQKYIDGQITQKMIDKFINEQIKSNSAENDMEQKTGNFLWEKLGVGKDNKKGIS